MNQDIIATVTANPVTVLIDAKTYSDFYARMKAEIADFVPDVSTVKGRGEIASLAFKVTKTKTAIDAAGKKLNEDARAQINAVDASRRKIREELDALADEVRRPLTEWEESEKERARKAKEIRENVVGLGNAAAHFGSVEIQDRIDELEKIVLDPEILRDEMADAVSDMSATKSHLSEVLVRAVKAEQEAAELAILRRKQAEREEEDRRRAEAAMIANEKAEREAREKAEYEANVKREAEAAEKAKREQAEREARAIEAARNEALEKSRREHAAEMAKIEAENKRLADAEAARIAEIEKGRRAMAAREADRAHRSKIMGEAKQALMALGVSEEIARTIVLALVSGEIPHTKWVF